MSSSAFSSNIISFQDAVKNYGARKTIGPVNLDVKKGEVLGFLGPNGSGKTTCIRMMLGLIRPSSGKVLVNGLDPISNHVNSLRNVAYSPELPNIQTFLTPSELLSLVLHELHFKSSKQAEVRRVLELVGLLEYADTKVGKLSKGMVQRLSVAQALIGSPEVLILDEPMIGLDPAGSSHFRELFREFSKDNKGTVFMSSHMMSEVESICTSVALIHSGTILFQGSIDDVIRRALNYTAIIVESSPLSESTLLKIRGLEGISEVRREEANYGNTITEVIAKSGADNDLRSKLSELIVGSGAKLFTIKRADNLLERAYIEALRGKSGGKKEEKQIESH
ncbi:MAG: ABC transporter ATP-binding protein [archaeon]|jgi:ABC-2 type transport system ATP-binding protein|nr:ABC transporter ATP-binding protein [archaeon]